MINQIRTILLNENGSANQDWSLPAEEFVDKNYKRKELSKKNDSVYRILFPAPDRVSKNLKLYNYLKIIHSCFLHDYATEDDPRLTYYPRILHEPPRNWLSLKNFDFEYKVISGQNKKILIYCNGDFTWQTPNFWSWLIDVSGNKAKIELVYPYGILLSPQIVDLTWNSGLSQQINLPEININIQLEQTPATMWNLKLFINPTFSIHETLDNLNNIAGSEELSLNNKITKTDYLQFLWKNSHNPLLRLGSFLLLFAKKIQMETQ